MTILGLAFEPLKSSCCTSRKLYILYEKMFRTIHPVLSGGQHLLIVLTDGIQNKENRTGHRAAESITPGTRRTPTLKMNCNAILHFLATLPRGLRGRCIATTDVRGTRHDPSMYGRDPTTTRERTALMTIIHERVINTWRCERAWEGGLKKAHLGSEI